MNSTCKLGRHSARALKPYPDYKDSGVQWLGKVPEHWRLPRLGALLRERGEMNGDRQVSEVLSVLRERGVIPYAEKGNIGNKKSEDITRYKVVRPDDIVVNCMNVIIGSVGLSRYTGCLSPVYYVLTRRSERDHPRYLNACFQTKPFQESLVRIGNGILAHRMRIPMELLKCEPFPRPPFEEQAAIVRFLDHADRRIRRYIRAKQKLIALLKEQKQAFIHQAVTGQINVRTGKPYQAYKPSGVEWFPEVPDHWNVLPMRRVIYSAVDGPHFSPTYLDTGIPFLSARNVKSDAWSLEDAKYISEEDYDEFNRRVKPVRGDVLYTKGGTTGVARVVDLTFPFQVWVHIAVLKVNKNAIDPGFLAAALNSTRCYEQSQLFTRGATNQDLGLGRMKGIELPVPPALAEQQTIVGYLRTGLGQVLEAISATHRDIGLLREYRTRLIADVVTGKFDVREAAARLPDEVEELEPLDEADTLIDGEEEPNDALATAP